MPKCFQIWPARSKLWSSAALQLPDRITDIGMTLHFLLRGPEVRLASCEDVAQVDAVMQVPIMLRSKYCQLEEQSEQDLTTLGECPLDQASMRPLACPHVLCIEPCTRAARMHS